MTAWARKWLLPSFIFLPLALFWYLAEVPASQRALLDLGTSTIGQGLFTILTRFKIILLISSATVLATTYLFTSKRNALGFRLGSALGIAALAYMTIGSMEMLREMLRKPYVIGQHMFSNGVRKSEVAAFNQNGYLTHTPWVRSEERALWAESSQNVTGRSEAFQKARLARGELMFRGQCMSCHTLNGYRAMHKLLKGRDEKGVSNLLKVLHDYRDDSPYRPFMPPLVGTSDEIEALGTYLTKQVAPAEPGSK